MAKIVDVTRPQPGIVRVLFADGELREIEFWRYARKDTTLARLKDRGFAARCRIADDGMALRWPGGIDMSAGAVKRMGKRVDAGGRDGKSKAMSRSEVSSRRSARGSNSKSESQTAVPVEASSKR